MEGVFDIKLIRTLHFGDLRCPFKSEMRSATKSFSWSSHSERNLSSTCSYTGWAIIAHGNFMRKICASWDFILSMRNICVIFEQDSLSMRNKCARFAQDCTYFLNAQYMRKICTRLYFQSAIYVQDITTIYALNIIIQQVIKFSIFSVQIDRSDYIQ